MFEKTNSYENFKQFRKMDRGIFEVFAIITGYTENVTFYSSLFMNLLL